MAIAAAARLTIADSSAVLRKPNTGTSQALNKIAPRHEPASPLANLTDGDLTTRWSSGTGQGPGSWVSVDLGSAQEFNQVVMNSGTSPGDYVYFGDPITLNNRLADPGAAAFNSPARTARRIVSTCTLRSSATSCNV